MRRVSIPFVIAIASASFTTAYKANHKVWPACRVELYSEASIVLRTVSLEAFTFAYTGHFDSILKEAETRFLQTLANVVPQDATPYPVNPDRKDIWSLIGIRINVLTDETVLRYKVDESYELQIRPVIDNDGYILLEAPTIYGVLHGLQTLLQLFEFGWIDGSGSFYDEGSDGNNGVPTYLIRDTPLQITDGPAYPYRGLLIDTARHFLPLSLILQNLDAMAMNKLNVLHWHVTDSQSWPFQSSSFPDLSAKGSYCAECVYSPADVNLVVEQAAARGIRIIAEFDLPGHSQAIGAAYPEFMTNCGDAIPSEPLDATNPALYSFVHRLYNEIATLWPDQWIHIGGDEVSMDCWKNSTKIQKWMQEHNMTSEVQLLDYFERDLMDYVTVTLKKRPIVWQELFDANVALPKETVIDVWKSWDLSARFKATAQSYQVLISACWYLDHLNQDWLSFYGCDPRDFNGTSAQKALVIGGHASMWGERVDETNFLARVWPRASATAEKLWTGNTTSAILSARPRLETFRCLMNQQGFPASPISPGTCAHKKQRSYFTSTVANKL